MATSVPNHLPEAGTAHRSAVRVDKAFFLSFFPTHVCVCVHVCACTFGEMHVPMLRIGMLSVTVKGQPQMPFFRSSTTPVCLIQGLWLLSGNFETVSLAGQEMPETYLPPPLL